MSKQIETREGARRQHRAVGIFAALQCWIRGLDGVCIQGRDLLRLLGLEYFKQSRKKWLREDFAEFFAFDYPVKSGPPNSLFSLFLSRISLADLPKGGNMSDGERIASIPEGGPRLDIFQLWKNPYALIHWPDLKKNFAALIPIFTQGANHDERLLSAYMNLIFTGQMSLPSFMKYLPPPQDDEKLFTETAKCL
jgi:hypothetical protein